jgi:hypothetical protein
MRSLRGGCSPGCAAGQSGGRSLSPAAEPPADHRAAVKPRSSAHEAAVADEPRGQARDVAGWMGHGRQRALVEHRRLVSTGRRAVYTNVFNRVKGLTACRPGRRRDCPSDGVPQAHCREMGAARRTATAQRDGDEAKHTKRFPQPSCATLGRGLHVRARLAAGDQTAWLYGQPVSSGPAAGGLAPCWPSCHRRRDHDCNTPLTRSVDRAFGLADRRRGIVCQAAWVAD